MNQSPEEWVEKAKQGDKEALEKLVLAIQDRIYGLALRMLWHPSDAQDATQEILIRLITHLGTFRGRSAFSTWAYRVAANYLLTTRKRRAEQGGLTFPRFGEQLDQGLSDAPLPPGTEVEQQLLVDEVKLGCTHGMLLCLDRKHRLAYILGDVFQITDKEGGRILEITPQAFRKRLSRSREAVRSFMQEKCGLVNRNAACRCRRRVHTAIRLGRVDPQNLLLAGHPARHPANVALLKGVQEMERLHRAAAVFRSAPEFAAPQDMLEGIKKLISSEELKVLGGS